MISLSNITADMKLEKYLDVICKFMADYLTKTGAEGYVLGLSGGVDSSLVAALAKKAVGKEKITCIMMPIDSNPMDLTDAVELANTLGLNFKIIDASDTFHQLVDSFKSQNIALDNASLANLKVRIRMSMLYAYAQSKHLLVLGTDNADERYTGYFTKWGDGACDLLPIVHLVKGEVVKASKILGVPTRLAERVPSAGLFEGQTDEKEMGVSYADLDNYLLGKKVDENVINRIEHLHQVSEHKRKPIPTAPKFNRD